MQVLLFTAAWLLCDRRTLRHRGTAFVAGLFLGPACRRSTSTVSRSSSGVPFVGLIFWLRTERSERKSVGVALLFAGLGVAAGASLGFFDLALRSQLYLRTLRGDVEQLALGAALAIVVAGALVAGVRWWSRRADDLAPRLRSAMRPGRFRGGRGCVLLGGFGAWFVRRTCRPCAARPTSW